MGDVQSELTWADVDRLSRLLASALPAATREATFDRVIGISRGGLIPAVLVAAHLRVKRVESVQIRLYDGDVRLAEPLLVGPPPATAGPSGDPTRTLVVDEILDSGRTMAYLRTMLPHASFAALVARHDGDRAVCRAHGLSAYSCGDTDAVRVWVAEGLATREWVLFPWSPPEDREAKAGAT